MPRRKVKVLEYNASLHLWHCPIWVVNVGSNLSKKIDIKGWINHSLQCVQYLCIVFYHPTLGFLFFFSFLNKVAIDLNMQHMDVKKIILNGKLEMEIHMEQPEGFVQ